MARTVFNYELSAMNYHYELPALIIADWRL